MTAYVVINEPCDADGCENGMAWILTVERDGTRRTERAPCLGCHGTGTVQRRVTCRECTYWSEDFYCSALDKFGTDPSWGCVEWEAKP